jgi:hypothetical protein
MSGQEDLMSHGGRVIGVHWLLPLLLFTPGLAMAQEVPSPEASSSPPPAARHEDGVEQVGGIAAGDSNVRHLLSPIERERMALLLNMPREARSRWARELFAQEPTCAEAQHVALKHFNITPENLADMRQRLKGKGALPVTVLSREFEGTAAQRRVRVRSSLGVPTNVTREGHHAKRQRYVGILSMNTPHLVFNTSILQSYGWTKIQHLVLKRVHGYYFLRRQYQTRLYVDPPTEGRAYATLALPISTHTGMIDNYTGGWFSRQLELVRLRGHLGPGQGGRKVAGPQTLGLGTMMNREPGAGNEK